MCIIAVKPEKARMFDEECIRQMFRRNPDGAGYMHVEDGAVRISKGFMDVESLLESLRQHDFEGKNLVLHFRIGTSGLKDGLNTHPYPVYEDNELECSSRIAVAHNGVLSAYTPKWGSKINDTQTFIRQVLQKLDYGFERDEEKLFLISKIIGTNKLAFLDESDDITLLGDFIEENGCYFSNTSYRPPVPVTKEPAYWKYYEPMELFDPELEDDRKHEIMEFQSERQLDGYISGRHDLYMVDTDLYEDIEGNYYDIDRESLIIYKN